MIITYEIGNNLYVNITNNVQTLVILRENLAGAFNHDLWLEKEPTSQEIIEDIFSRNLSQYQQLVFCGFGEPLEI